MRKFLLPITTMCVVLVMSLFLQSSAPYDTIPDSETESVTDAFAVDASDTEEPTTEKEYTIVIVPATEKEEMNKIDEEADKAWHRQDLPEWMGGFSYMLGDTSVLTVEQAYSVKKGMHHKEVAELVGYSFVSGPLFGLNSEIFLVEGGYTMLVVYSGLDSAYVDTAELSRTPWQSVEKMRDYIERGKRATADNREEVLKLWIPSLEPDAEQ